MANEITYTGKSDLFIAAALNQMLWQLIVDKTDLRSLCVNHGSINGSGSTASKVAQVSWDDAMAASNVDEVTADGNTDLGTAAITITVARQAIVRHVTDLYEIVGGPRPGASAFAQDMANAASLRFTDMICALFTNLSNSVASTTVDLSVDFVSDAMYQLIQARVAGPYSAVLAPIQLTDFLDSLRSEGGSAEFQQPQTEDMLTLDSGSPGYGLHGRWRGVDYWSSDSVTTNGPDREGAMFGRGCYGYREGVPSGLLAHSAPGSFASATPAGAPIMVEFERKVDPGHTLVAGSYFVGVAEVEDARGVLIPSSAT